MKPCSFYVNRDFFPLYLCSLLVKVEGSGARTPAMNSRPTTHWLAVTRAGSFTLWDLTSPSVGQGVRGEWVIAQKAQRQLALWKDRCRLFHLPTKKGWSIWVAVECVTFTLWEFAHLYTSGRCTFLHVNCTLVKRWAKNKWTSKCTQP